MHPVHLSSSEVFVLDSTPAKQLVFFSKLSKMSVTSMHLVKCFGNGKLPVVAFLQSKKAGILDLRKVKTIARTVFSPPARPLRQSVLHSSYCHDSSNLLSFKPKE